MEPALPTSDGGPASKTEEAGDVDAGADLDGGSLPPATGNPRWVDHFGTSIGGDPRLAVDKTGNTYFIVPYQGDLLRGQDAGLGGAPSGYVVAKVDVSGHLVWVRTLLSDFVSPDALAIAVDSANLVLVGGMGSETISIPPFSLAHPTQFGFVARLDPVDGHALWATILKAEQAAVAAVTESNGVIVAAGSCQGPTLIADNGSASTSHAGRVDAGGTELFVAGLEPANGSVKWAHFGGTNDDDIVTSATSDELGNFYVAARLKGYDFGSRDNWAGPALQRVSGAAPDAYETLLLRLSSAGSLVWRQRLGSTTSTRFETRGLAASLAGNRLVATGSLSGSATVGAGMLDGLTGAAFVMNVEPATGVPTWAKVYPGFEGGAVGLDEVGQSVIVATKNGAPTAFAGEPFSAALDEGVIAKLAGDGRLRWVRNLRTPISARWVAARRDNVGEIVVGGSFQGGAVDFGIGGPRTSALSGTYPDTFWLGLDP